MRAQTIMSSFLSVALSSSSYCMYSRAISLPTIADLPRGALGGIENDKHTAKKGSKRATGRRMRMVFETVFPLLIPANFPRHVTIKKS
jgi:hypothetical protein